MKVTFASLPAFLMISLLSPSAPASEIQSQTSTSPGSLSEALSYSGESKEKDSFDWSLSYGYTSTELSSSASDHTHSFGAGLGYSQKEWNGGIDFNFSSTKEENLSSFGPSAYVSYRMQLVQKTSKSNKAKPNPGEDEADEEAEFVPSLKFYLSGGTTRYTQSSGGSTTLRKGSRRTVGKLSANQLMQQNQIEVATTLKAIERLDFKIFYIKYAYDKDVATYLASLDSPRAIRNGTSSFASTLSGFSSHEWGINLSFHLPLEIDLEPEYSQSTNAVDSSKSNTYRVSLERTWADTWKTGLGYQTTHYSSESSQLFLFTLAYEF